MKKHSAGLLVYRRRSDTIEVLLVHPGGPFWSKKDIGAWSIPKGEYEEGEDPLETAKREFGEEIGKEAPEGKLAELGEIEQKNIKIVVAWAIEGDLDVSGVQSNTIFIDWPPRSGKKMEIPEVDRAEWFEISQAAPKMHQGQAIFLERLAKILGNNFILAPEPEQSKLF